MLTGKDVMLCLRVFLVQVQCLIHYATLSLTVLTEQVFAKITIIYVQGSKGIESH